MGKLHNKAAKSTSLRLANMLPFQAACIVLVGQFAVFSPASTALAQSSYCQQLLGLISQTKQSMQSGVDNKYKIQALNSRIATYNAYCTGGGRTGGNTSRKTGGSYLPPSQLFPDLSTIRRPNYQGKYSGSVTRAQRSASGMDMSPPSRAEASRSVRYRDAKVCRSLNPHAKCQSLRSNGAAYEHCVWIEYQGQFQCALDNARMAQIENAKAKARGETVYDNPYPCFLARQRRDAYCANFAAPTNSRCYARYDKLYRQCVKLNLRRAN